MSFRTRLTLFFLLIVVLPMVAVAVIVVQVSDESETGKADARLAAGIETALAVYGDHLEKGAQAAREAARDPGLVSALRSGERSRVAAAARRVARAEDLDLLAAEDARGRRLARVGDAEAIARGAVNLEQEGKPLATVVASVTTAPSFATEVRALTGRDAAVLSGGETLATTIAPGGVRIPASGEAITAETEGDDVRIASAELEEGGVRLALFGPVESGGLAVTRPLAGVALTAFFIVALFFVAILLRTLQGQVTAMLGAARRIGEGDFSARVPVEGRDEMAGLASEFNRMTERLNAQVDELRHQRLELDHSVQRIGEAFASGLDRSALLEIVVETALSACDAEYGLIALAGTEEVEVGGPPSGPLEAAVRAAEVAATGDGGLAEAERGGVHALAHPLVRAGGDGAGVGVMVIARSGEPFDRHQKEVLQYLIGQASVSIENVGLHELVAEQAVTDELTGLANNRRFREWIDNEFARAQRFGHDLSLVMLDIDDFKRVNDELGHLQGDEVLRMIGRVLRSESRGVDQPARYGGEEFVVGLPETRLEGAIEVAERIRTRVAEEAVPRVGDSGMIRVTVSLGVASLGRGVSDVRSLIAGADEALYRAKREGKNRTEHAPAPAGASR